MIGTPPSTFNIFDVNQQKVLPFTLKEAIDEGSFGKVFMAGCAEYNEPLIGKSIDLQGKTNHIHYSPHHLLRLTYREIAYLQQLDLLVGYQHDVENKKMLIIMKHLPGVPEFRVKPKSKRLAEFASFCALRNLHRQGVAHMDPHEYNFLYDEKACHAEVIDFGLAQDAQIFRQLRDFHQFLKLRRSDPSFLSKDGRATLWYFVDFYCTELKDHILAHRYEIAQTVFCYAAVVIAALCGASVLGVASLLAQELIKATLLPSLSDLLAALQDHYEYRAFNQQNKMAYRSFHYALVGTLVVLQGFIAALQINALYNVSTALLTELATLGAVAANSQVFWQSCIASFPLYDTVTAGIQVQALFNTCQYWYHNAEKYLFSDSLIMTSYQNKIAANGKAKAFLPLFKQAPLPNTTTKTVNTPETLRSSPLLRI